MRSPTMTGGLNWVGGQRPRLTAQARADPLRCAWVLGEPGRGPGERVRRLAAAGAGGPIWATLALRRGRCMVRRRSALPSCGSTRCSLSSPFRLPTRGAGHRGAGRLGAVREPLDAARDRWRRACCRSAAASREQRPAISGPARSGSICTTSTACFSATRSASRARWDSTCSVGGTAAEPTLRGLARLADARFGDFQAPFVQGVAQLRAEAARCQPRPVAHRREHPHRSKRTCRWISRSPASSAARLDGPLSVRAHTDSVSSGLLEAVTPAVDRRRRDARG